MKGQWTRCLKLAYINSCKHGHMISYKGRFSQKPRLRGHCTCNTRRKLICSYYLLQLMAASTVKCTTPLPCISLSESDLKLYTNFEFCEGKYYKHLRNTLICKAKYFMVINFFSRKVYIYFEDNASSVQVNILNM